MPGAWEAYFCKVRLPSFFMCFQIFMSGMWKQGQIQILDQMMWAGFVVR